MDQRAVCHGADDELDAGDGLAMAVVERVEDDRLVAGRLQESGRLGADVAGAARDQDAHVPVSAWEDCRRRPARAAGWSGSPPSSDAAGLDALSARRRRRPRAATTWPCGLRGRRSAGSPWLAAGPRPSDGSRRPPFRSPPGSDEGLRRRRRSPPRSVKITPATGAPTRRSDSAANATSSRRDRSRRATRTTESAAWARASVTGEAWMGAAHDH